MNNTVITIGRELGSGGRTIGKLVAGKLEIPYYDREMIDEAAKKSGLSEDFIRKSEQKMTTSFLYNMAMGAGYGINMFAGNGKENLSLEMQVYMAQRDVVLSLVEKGSCVIVGRCADYVLRDRENLLRCFIYADMPSRIDRAINEYGMNRDEAEKLISQSDKKRANHYHAFTEQQWGNRRNYDLLINSSRCGIENASEMIIRTVGNRINNKY
jgi:cytidylate kinase